MTRHYSNLIGLLALLAAEVAGAQGLLIPSDTSLGPLGIKYQRVSAEIQDGAAVTKVDQVFVNSGPRQLEAQFVFPLPKGAALQEFYLWMNGKRTKGEILEKDKASNIYEGIVRRLQDPGLLEYIDSDVFRARVFPVPANGEMRIELTFSQVLDFQNGVYRYRYPLGAGTRGAAALKVKQDFTFSASVKSRIPLRSIYSPTHRLGVSNKGENAAVVGLELGAGADISKDLDLYYSVSDKAVGLSLLTYRNSLEEPGYFIALISPRNEVPANEIVAKRVTFVIDTSGSMMGERIKLARDSLKYCVTRLNPNDEFNVVRFSTDVESLFEKPKVATAENVKKAVDFVGTFEAIGGTAIDEALVRGLKDGEGKGEKPHLVMFITDGHPTVGETDEAAIVKHARDANKGRSRVFTFGVGDDLNARLIDRLAEDGNGTSDFMRDGKEHEAKISGFFDKIANPVLADLSLDMGAFTTFDVYPKKLPDLFKGSQLVVMGRYRTASDGAVVLSGSVNGKKKVYEFRATATNDSKAQDFIPRLWAIRKVGYVLDEIRLRGEKPELKDEVILLGKKFGIVTPYTSYLVVEDAPMQVANNRPPPPKPWRVEDEGHRGALGANEKPAARFAPSPSSEPTKDDDASAFEKSFGSSGRGSASAPAPTLQSSDGKAGIAVAKKMREMKEEQQAPKDSEPVRVAGGRTFIYRSGGWVDSEALGGVARQIKIKYLSDAYFALLKAKPELKAALALGDRVMVLLAAGKAVVIDPTEGETTVDKLTAFLK